MSDPSSDTFEILAADGARARLRLRGAQLLSWHPAGSNRDRLFLSRKADYAHGVAVRGGVPVIFPQFADCGPLPKHGFARTAPWQLLDHQLDADGAATARLRLTDSADTRQLWPYAFAVELTVSVSGACLQLALQIHNPGTAAFSFTAALHTYLRVEELAQVRVHGLNGLRYRDSVTASEHRETRDSLEIAGEFDRIYLDAPSPLQVHDGNGRYELQQSGFRDTVIWNPGAARAAALSDLEPEGWRQLLCVEAATVATPVTLPAGARWHGRQTILRR
jgi:glucose-6-phosphate 1-epimerase